MARYIVVFFLLCNNHCLAETANVKRVIDGDTFISENGDRIRLLGVDAPELDDHFGQEAKEYLASLILGKNVRLEIDGISPDKDRYGRLLRYVYIDTVDINNQIILNGFAHALTKYKIDKEADYKVSEANARESNVGLWHVKNEPTSLENFATSDKKYVVVGLVLLLILLGILSSFKKS